MAIYVGENNALLLKNDRSVVEFYKGNQKIFGYNGNANGETITVDNVHPVEHKLKVKLSSDTVTDFSGISVKRYGKNLFTPEILTISNNAKNFTISNNEFSFERTVYTGGISVAYDIYLKAGIYTLSGNADCSDGTNTMGTAVRLGSAFIANKSSAGSKNGINYSFTVEESNTYRINFYSSGSTAGTVTTFKNIQLEYGSGATDYEQYKECQTATANTNGIVEGLTSVSPNMTVLSNSADVLINVSYS